MNIIILTNNPMTGKNLSSAGTVINKTGCSHLETLKAARDLIHKGHKLLTHPVSGSIKPNETAYKSMALSADAAGLCLDSLGLIEQAIASCEKFEASKPGRHWPEKILEDFALIDYDLIKNALGG